ncbi:MAG: GNAT family protein [Nanoarchaeota archaeon]|nr:GNAT family protein [Nanoarchaeota archaeon]
MNDGIIIRKAKKGDEIGIRNMIRYALSIKAWPYVAMIKYTKKKFGQLKKAIFSKQDIVFFVAEDTEKKKIAGVSNYSFRKGSRLRHSIDMGWSIHPYYIQKGIGTRLLNAILEHAKKNGYKRAEAEAAVENKASVKLALRCGFKIEGRKKKALLLDDGRMIDTYVFGKLL